MGELALNFWDWQKDYEEIRQTLRQRFAYRRGGKPCPTELTNAEEIIQSLERMIPHLQHQINEELKQQALTTIQTITTKHREQLTKPTQNTPTPEDMPLTPGELQLRELTRLMYQARSDAKEQVDVRFQLYLHKYCGTECWYPDVCGDSPYRGDCRLKQLAFRTEATGWRRLLGQRFVPPCSFDAPQNYAFKRIRRSQYYTAQDDDRLKRIFTSGCLYEPELCRYWAQELVKLVDNRCRMCRKTYNEIQRRDND